MTTLEFEDGRDIISPSHIGNLEVRQAALDLPNLNMLVYGDYGVGKTLLAGTCNDVEQMRKVLFLDIEGGTFTLRHKYPSTDVVRITDWNQLTDIYNELKAGLHGQYRTIVIDSLTEAQVANMAKIMKELVKLKPERNEDVPDIREWGINQVQVKRMIRAFRDLPVTTIFTGLMKEDKNKLTGKVTKGPDLPGKLAKQVPALFDEVFYYYIRNVELEGDDGPKEHRILLTGATEDTAAKDRSGQLPKVIVDPTMQKIYDLMMGNVHE